MSWSSRLSVGVDWIDGEHQELVRLLNALADAMKEGRGAQLVERTLNGLADYTRTHFEHEEREMRRLRYPDAAAHEAAHAGFRATVADLQERVAAAKPLSSAEVLDVLRRWLSSHIQETDAAFGAWLVAQGEARSAV